MSVTRENILKHLAKYHTATAGDLSKSLDRTPADIRYHLAALKKARTIRTLGDRKPGGAGRPAIVYGLSPSAQGTAFSEFTRAVCSVLESDPSSEVLVDKFAAHLTRKFKPPPRSQITLFNQAVDYLNQLMYQAAWEARPEGPRILLHHCPYLDLPHQNAILCEMDQRLVSRLFCRPLILAEKRSPDLLPSDRCIFESPPDSALQT